MHRLYILATVAIWAVATPLFVAAPDHGPLHRLSLVMGCLAVVMLPYVMFPWLVSDMLDKKLTDTTGAFLSGWQSAQEQQGEPDEPATVHPIRPVCG